VVFSGGQNPKEWENITSEAAKKRRKSKLLSRPRIKWERGMELNMYLLEDVLNLA
jgi:hypothetical protein